MKSWLLAITSVTVGFSAGYLTALPAGEMAERSTTPILAEAGRVVFIPQAAAEEVAPGSDRAESDARIRELQEKNEHLAAQIARMNLPMGADTTYPELLERIDSLPEPVLKAQMSRVFDEEGLRNIQDIKAFSRRLAEVLLDDESSGDAGGTASVYFSKSPMYGSRMLEPSAAVDVRDTIFAHIVANGALGEVLVKWQRARTGEVLLMENYSFRGDESKYVPLRPSGGWEPGSYRVSVYSMDDRVSSIGSGSYSLANVTGALNDEAVDGPDMNIIRELIQTGQATPKGSR